MNESSGEIIEGETDRSNDGTPDRRLYATAPDNWTAEIKQSSEKEYCHCQNPGEDFYHLLMKGELFLQQEGAKYCIGCAIRVETLTEDRLHWQHVKTTPSKNPL